jgi:hypothetical protein
VRACESGENDEGGEPPVHDAFLLLAEMEA